MQKPGARGESMVIDLTFAVFIFLLVAWSLTSVWSNKAAESEKQIYEDETLLLAEKALGTLITSSGQPQDWETKPFADVNVIGLAKSDRVLDGEKINKLIEFVGGEELPELVGFWKFEKGSDVTTEDSSGNQNHGTLTNFACTTLDCNSSSGWVSNGHSGNAIAFDGAGDYVDVGDADVFSFGNGFGSNDPHTISFWVNTGDMTNNMFTGKKLEYYVSGNVSDRLVIILYGETGYLGAQTASSFLTPHENKWTHFVIVYDGGTTDSALTAYINGSQISLSGVGSGTYNYAKNTADPLYIARYSTSNFGNGLIDEVGVFNRALSQEEIWHIHQKGISLGGYRKTGQKLLIGANDYYFRLIDPSTGEAVKNGEGQFIKIGKKPTNGWLQTTIKRPVVFAYKRRGEDEAKEHEAIAELTLFLPYRMW